MILYSCALVPLVMIFAFCSVKSKGILCFLLNCFKDCFSELIEWCLSCISSKKEFIVEKIVEKIVVSECGSKSDSENTEKEEPKKIRGKRNYKKN